VTQRRIRGVRGATTVERDEAILICGATRELLTELLARNQATPRDVVSAMFTATIDLRSEFPARAGRELGWEDVAMLCAVEMPVPGAMPRCIRVSLHMELPEEQVVQHAYLRGAEELRPDRYSSGTIRLKEPE
jgi:chorismate mutase